MRRSNRTKEEIIANILKNCLAGANKTTIIHKSNSNFAETTPYLNCLTQSGLVTIIGCFPTTYKTTDEGKDFLNRLNELHKLKP